MSNNDYLLDERGRIDHSHLMADMVIDQAYQVRQDLNEQGNVLYKSGSTMNGLGSRFPLINNVLRKIDHRKRKESIIMGIIIGLCIVFILWYLL